MDAVREGTYSLALGLFCLLTVKRRVKTMVPNAKLSCFLCEGLLAAKDLPMKCNVSPIKQTVVNVIGCPSGYGHQNYEVTASGVKRVSGTVS